MVMRDALLVKGAHVGHVVHAAHLGREEALRRHDFQPRAGLGDQLGRRHARDGRHCRRRAARSRPACTAPDKDVPARGDEVVARLQRRVLRQAAGGDDHDVGCQRQHVVRLGPGVVADVDAEPLQFGEPPVDDADQFAPARVLRRQPNLPAGLAGRLQHRHLVAALGRDPRCLQARRRRRRPRRHLARGPSASGDHVRHRRLAARRRVVDAQRLAALVDAVEAVGRADAGADLVLAALHRSS